MKHLCALLPGLILLAAAVPASADTAVLGLPQFYTEVNVGDTFNVTIELLTAGNSVAGYQFDFQYPTFVEATGVVEDGYFADNGCCFSYNSIDNTDGVISGISDVVFPSLTSNDDLVTISFTALATGSSYFSFQNAALSDEDGNAIPLGVGSGDITVASAGGGSGSSAPEPAPGVLLIPAAGYLIWRRAPRRTAAR